MANDDGSTASPASHKSHASFARDTAPNDFEDAWRQALADMDEARKRHALELRHAVDSERHRVCLAWLPVLDGLEANIEQAEGDLAALIGVRAVRDQAVALLASLGFPRDEQTGVPFDPERHELAELVDDPTVPPGTVVRVLRPGYGEPPAGRLRLAAVVVSRNHHD